MGAPKKGIGVILAGLKGAKASNDVEADPMDDEEDDEAGYGDDAEATFAELFPGHSDVAEGLAAFKALVRSCKGG